MIAPRLARGTVDRDGAARASEEALRQLWLTGAVLVVDEQGRAQVDGTDLVLIPSEQAPDGERVYLGALDGAAYFAVRGEGPRRLGARPLGLREVGAVLGDRDGGLLVHAVGMLNWHDAHRHCSRCGTSTVSTKGGSVRVCPEHGELFPRTDPAVIVLVTDGGDRCVLGRQAGWPAGRYSTLAGFVEPGESVEQAVVREVLEESGLQVREVTYRASQPWPFPSSVMLGFRAICDADAVPRVNDDELEDVRWFTRDELRAGRQRPPEVSIAHSLLSEWLDG